MFDKKNLAPEWEYEEAPELPEVPGETPATPPEGTPPALSDDTEIEVNGEKIKVGELKKGYQRQSDYTKKSQELAEERKKLEGKGGEPPKGKPSAYPEDDRKTAKYLMEIIMKDEDLRKEFGVVTEADLRQRDFVKELTSQAAVLEKEFDGKNGLPKFVEEEILQHMQDEGFRNMRKAYIDKYHDEYIEWASKQKKGNSGYKSEGKGGPVLPKKKEFPRTPQGFKDSASSVLEEMLKDK